MMVEALQRLTDRGFAEVVLWVLEANERARRFYEAADGSPTAAPRTSSSAAVGSMR